MSKCSDPEKGELLHAYELNALSEEDKERFEIHLLECEYCYNELKAFEEEAALLRSSDEVRELVKEAGRMVARSEGSFVRRFWKHIWPDAPVLAKPALLYLLILLLLVPAYRGFKGPERKGVRRLQTHGFFLDRSASEGAFSKSIGDDGLITFVFKGAVPGKSYHVLIRSEGGTIVFEDDAYDGFDEYDTGRLLLPLREMKPGHYRLVITDPRAEHPFNVQEYSFKVEK